MKLAKSTILKRANKLDEAFSLMETVIVVTIISVFIVLVIDVFFSINKNYHKLQNNSVLTREVTLFITKINLDVLGVDLYPKHFKEDYNLGDRNIVFFSHGRRVEYSYNSGNFYISEHAKDYCSEDSTEYDFVNDFSVDYYDSDGFLCPSDDKPFFCRMKFCFNGGKPFKLDMRL